MAKESPPSPDQDLPDSFVSPRRYEFIPRDEQERRQALADWFQVTPTFNPKRNIHAINVLMGETLDRLSTKFKFEEEAMDPEMLRKGWEKAAGPFLGAQAHLLSIVKGVATIQVLHPALHYQIIQCKGALLTKLKNEFGEDKVRSLSVRIGA